jgi:alkanesulfonate monooxygenase SsuD/methylene tetrahydromethanopterin reductase-like flavin-dependent oxidoreductase (luciferase family)
MRLGIGLPNVLPGTTGELMVEWARRAEERGFAFVSTIGRLGYPSYDPLLSLAVAAGATSRIGLLSNVELTPLTPDLLLVKEVLTLAQLSAGRLTLGVGLGARRSDYEMLGADFAGRGATLDRQLDLLDRTWRGEPIVDGEPIVPTALPRRPSILIGGHSAAAVRRVIRHGDGWTGATGGVARNGPVADEVRTAWARAGRAGQPRLAALVYFGLGPDAREASEHNLASYYAFFGTQRAGLISAEAARSPAGLAAAIREYADHGFTDMVLTPTVAELSQLDRLADLVA